MQHITYRFMCLEFRPGQREQRGLHLIFEGIHLCISVTQLPMCCRTGSVETVLQHRVVPCQGVWHPEDLRCRKGIPVGQAVNRAALRLRDRAADCTRFCCPFII